MQVLVTGAAGEIGRSLVGHLASREHGVRASKQIQEDIAKYFYRREGDL